MTRVAAVRGSSGLPVGSVSDVAAQMPLVTIRARTAESNGHIAASVTSAIPADTTHHGHGGIQTRGAEHAPLVRPPIAHAQPHQHAERGERHGHHRIEQAAATAEDRG